MRMEVQQLREIDNLREQEKKKRFIPKIKLRKLRGMNLQGTNFTRLQGPTFFTLLGQTTLPYKVGQFYTF